MREFASQKLPITRSVMIREDAITFFKNQKEFYKAEIIESIPPMEELSLYSQGDFIDLCRGPHGPNTSFIKHFKLLKVAGAYWRGDSKNQMLQRIYGTCFATDADLKQYLFMKEEAEKRDHRKLGLRLDLFHFQKEAQGSVFWHDKGYTLYRIVENYIRDKLKKQDYTEVKTPVLVDYSLWEASGHADKYSDNMFTSVVDEQKYALKPMNCPCHVQIFKQGIKSYRDLPIRMSEFGSCHRNEASGALHGLMRLRGFAQDDAHIFCTKDQIEEETIAFCKLLKEVYKDFGFEEIIVKFSDRPDVRAGSDEVWTDAEVALESAAKKAGIELIHNKGEGAFYGPKLEFTLKDAIGRHWQCGTLQLDFVLPERLDATYIEKDGSKQRPVMLHRAILGSLERFLGILIEEHAGKFPLWLAPVQASIATVTDTDEMLSYAKSVEKTLKNAGVRIETDYSSEKIGYKIREISHKKVPICVIIGKQEMESQTLTLRKLGSEEKITCSVQELIELCNANKY
jgi:threonyl-tRNA synthetase